MRFKLAIAIGMGALLVAATVTPANAATNTITIGASPTLTGAAVDYGLDHCCLRSATRHALRERCLGALPADLG